MARTEKQWESIRQLEWALSFAQADLKGITKDKRKRLVYEIDTFVRKAAGVFYKHNAEQSILAVQAGLKKQLGKLAEMQPARVPDSSGWKDSYMTWTSIPAAGSVKLIALGGDPYRQVIESDEVELQVYSALATHLVASGIVGGQLRVCPECGKLFLLKLKPQPNREFHCCTTCTNRATFRRFALKRTERAQQVAARELRHSHKALPATIKKIR